ncbi:hypothetical protein BGZ63DRAFT_370269, partial [Mariannaea sp. PMI_226]
MQVGFQSSAIALLSIGFESTLLLSTTNKGPWIDDVRGGKVPVGCFHQGPVRRIYKHKARPRLSSASHKKNEIISLRCKALIRHWRHRCFMRPSHV